MNSNLLNNKLFLGIIVIVVIVLIVAISSVVGGGGTGKKKNKDVQLKNFKTLQEDIKTLAAQKWSKADYDLLIKTLNDYAKTKPDPLISEENKVELTKLLTSKYISLLNDTVLNFCKSGSDKLSFEELEIEVNKFNTAETADLVSNANKAITAYNDALNTVGGISAYSGNKEYVKSTTDAYTQRITESIMNTYISENTYLLDLLKTGDTRLVLHKNAHEDFENNFKFCDCKNYKTFKFYELKCDSIKESL